MIEFVSKLDDVGKFFGMVFAFLNAFSANTLPLEPKDALTP